jgi:hypothetical protein
MRRVLDQKYQLTGNELSRLLRTTLLSRLIPCGNWRGGPGMRCLVVLALLHYAGRPLYLLIARYGERLRPLRQKVARFRQRG